MRELRAAVPLIPLDRLLIETDAPYLLPRDLAPKPQNRRNEPQFLAHVLERVAALMKQPVDVVAQATTANAERLFGLARASKTRELQGAGSIAALTRSQCGANATSKRSRSACVGTAIALDELGRRRARRADGPS